MIKKSVPTISILTFLCLTAFVWLPPIQREMDRTFFLTARSVSLLGFILLTALVCAYGLTESSISWLVRLKNIIKNHFCLFAFLFFTLLLAALIFINQYALSAFFSSGDEHSCYFLAECIKSGRLWFPVHPLQEFFDVVHVGSRNGKWFSVYPPGWPALFALGLKLNLADWINPIIALISVFFLYKIGRRIFNFSSAVIGIVLMSSTPFFLLNSASYFSHSACLLLITIFIYSYFRRLSERWLR